MGIDKCNNSTTGGIVFPGDEMDDTDTGQSTLPLMAIFIGAIIVIVIIVISRKAYTYWRQSDEHVRYSF